MEIFDKSIKKKLYDRLMYIISTQNWEPMGNHYWIKQCLELILNVVQKERRVICSSLHSRLPSCKAILIQSGNKSAKSVLQTSKEKNDQSYQFSNVKIKSEPLDDVEMASATESKDNSDVFLSSHFALCKNGKEILEKLKKEKGNQKQEQQRLDYDHLVSQLIEEQSKFLGSLKNINIGPFMHAVSQLAHRSTLLAHKIWVDMFPHVWDLLEEKQHMVLSGELGPFLCSGSHLSQTEGYRSAINTLVEGMSHCNPPIPIRPVSLKYLGKTHNLWHQAALMLENMAVACDDMTAVNPSLPTQQPWLDFGMFLVFSYDR